MKYTETEQAVIELGGEWPSEYTKAGYLLDYLSPKVWTVSSTSPGKHLCTHYEFMETRARLENKPGWDDAPEWAGWLAQDSDGRWFWSEKSPKRFDHSPDNEWDCSVSGKFLWATNEGVCFTDWRESLEHRPEPTSNPQWMPEETLPPVGAFVDVTGDVLYGSGETNCEVVAHVEDCAVIRMSYGLGCFMSYVLSPTKTERERVIQAAMQAGMRDGGYRLPSDFCKALYDAGMLVMPNKE